MAKNIEFCGELHGLSRVIRAITVTSQPTMEMRCNRTTSDTHSICESSKKITIHESTIGINESPIQRDEIHEYS